jgi:hypothetical protein
VQSCASRPPLVRDGLHSCIFKLQQSAITCYQGLNIWYDFAFASHGSASISLSIGPASIYQTPLNMNNSWLSCNTISSKRDLYAKILQPGMRHVSTEFYSGFSLDSMHTGKILSSDFCTDSCQLVLPHFSELKNAVHD